MRIQHNVTAMNSHRMYTINASNMAKNVEKLSSGYKINRAGDDAAGLAISEKMRGQIRGLTMASKNSQDAISLIQTAEGALQSTQDILQRMRELAVQSSSDTNLNPVDREALDMEFQQLKQEIDDTAAKTEFNKMKLIDGSFGNKLTVTNAKATYSLTDLRLTGGFKETDLIRLGAFGSGGPSLGGSKGTAPAASTIILTDVVKPGTTGTGTGTTGSVTITLAAADWTATTISGLDGDGETIILGTSYSATFTNDGVTYNISFAVMTDDTGGTKNSAAMTADISLTSESDAKVIQIGANQGDTMNLSIAKMSTTHLGDYGDQKFNTETGALNGTLGESNKLSGMDVTTRTNASDAIRVVDGALNMVSMQRAALGAKQNRLEFKIQNLDNSTENLQAAESRIRDTDMANEMTKFIKNNILFQASTAMLAQANSLPQGVLQLLG